MITDHRRRSSGDSDVPRVGHCKRDRCDVYIGRGSRWGNPFVFPGRRSKHDVTETDTPLADYERHVRASPGLMAALPELRGKALGCWCVRLADPEPDRPEDERCHGHVLQRLVREVCGDRSSKDSEHA